MIEVNASDVNFKTRKVTITLSNNVCLDFLKILLSMGYTNVTYDGSRSICNLILKNGDKAYISISSHRFADKLCNISIANGKFKGIDLSILNRDELVSVFRNKVWLYNTVAEKKTAHKNFRRTVRRRLMSPENILIKEIVE